MARADFNATNHHAAQTFIADAVRVFTAARAAAGLSQRRLAARIGCTQRSIANTENGDITLASLPALGRLAAALGMNLQVTITLTAAGHDEPPAAGQGNVRV